jgi:phenolic acid decarboxylase
MQTLKFRKTGNSLKLVLARRRLVSMVPHSRNVQSSPNKVVSSESQFEKAMEAYRQVSSKYRNALRELAK